MKTTNELYEVRTYGATNTKGTRIRILGLSNRYYGYDYKYNNSLDMALDILEENGITRASNIIHTTWCDETKSYFITSNK